MQKNSIKFWGDKASYYLEAKRILKNSKTLKVVAKTPTLFITSQRKKDYQKKYYDELMRSLKRNIRIEYLFSLPFTTEELLSEDKKTAFKDLSEWSAFSKHPKINIRFLKTRNPFSCVIGDRETAVLIVYANGKRGCLTVSNNVTAFHNKAFSQLFRSASNKHGPAIKEIKKSIENR